MRRSCTEEDAGSGLCIAVIDIDHFKAINDAHGHEAGDAVLEHFAAPAASRCGHRIDLGRTGGEEFLLLLPEVRLDDAVRIIERIRDGFPAAGAGETTGSNCLAPSARA